MWSPEWNRWLIEIRYPDGSRVRKRFRREREALRIWSAEQTKIENGTWHEQAPKTVTFENALKQYREYSTVQNRSHNSYVEPALSVWETHIKASTLLAKSTPALIEDVKLRRAQAVAHSTVDKDLAVLKAFFNWCIARSLAASNPVSRVKFFNEDNSRLRYLTEDEYKRLIEAAIISIAQQANPNCSHQSDERRPQLKRKSSEVVKTFLSNRSSIRPIQGPPSSRHRHIRGQAGR